MPIPLELYLDLFPGQNGRGALERQCEAGHGKTQAVRH